ncbi:hypothetical protein [Citreimonas salinaria]|uniref:Uncharacterized protein n=1 Tax=Citreimonas salinaria TaxID=321339 RepID=A0A1H3IGC9_9RHOB|nr:hypothetical protein [Citreimonas salinaria]SDY26682.1 hypothetical protein SAMN05444340_10547 [Citreimonas salinaria]
MHWSLVTQRWSTIRTLLEQRFPRLRAEDICEPPLDRETLVRLLAETNDLTLFEAGEELEDVLQIERMALPLSVQLH